MKINRRLPRAGTKDRRERILRAAERVFAERGFDGASLRRIVALAGVNLATVYYYFKSKEALMAAVCIERFGPLKQEQIALLDEAQRVSGPGAPTLERILEALLLPALRLATVDSAQRTLEMRLLGRLLTEPNRRLQMLLHAHFADGRAAFADALRRPLPRLAPVDLAWRMELLWGALAFVLCDPGRMKRLTGGVCDPADTRTVLAQMTAFFAAGLRGPSA